MTATATRTPITSQSSPLRINCVPCRNGLIGMTLCPGKQQSDSLSGVWARDLPTDVSAIHAWGAGLVVTLFEDHEFEMLRVSSLPQVVRAAGMGWIHLPICDQEAPDERFFSAWPDVSNRIHNLLEEGGRILLHCMGGLGRTGTVAAQLLIEAGEQPGSAISRVRAARPGAIETQTQEDYVLNLRSS